MYLGYRFAQALPEPITEPATQSVLPNAAHIGVTDFAGTVTQDATKLRLTRPISDGQGFEHCAPGARIRFGLTMAAKGAVEVHINWTGLVTRLSTYNDVGSIYVDGALATDFYGPGAWVFNNPHPTGSTVVPLVLNPGTRTVEIVLPHCASLDLTGLKVPASAVMAAPSVRTAQKCVLVGDSIIHGFNSTAVRNSWGFLLCAAKGWQMINLGYGGRRITASDFTVAANVGAQRTLTNIGINNCLGGDSTAVIQSLAQSSLTAFRTASPGQPLYWVNLFDCTNPGLITAPASARTAIQAAFTAVNNVNNHLISGGTANGLPSASTFLDLTHPDDLECQQIATALYDLAA